MDFMMFIGYNIKATNMSKRNFIHNQNEIVNCLKCCVCIELYNILSFIAIKVMNSNIVIGSSGKDMKFVKFCLFNWKFGLFVVAFIDKVFNILSQYDCSYN